METNNLDENQDKLNKYLDTFLSSNNEEKV
jgi:hypothetical protein